MNEKPRRRWFTFSLRTLLVVVTAVACWLGYAMRWIDQRREFLSTHNLAVQWPGISPAASTKAPWGLWLLGEEGQSDVTIVTDQDKGQQQLLESLFPEATVGVIVRLQNLSPSDRERFDAESDNGPELRTPRLFPTRDSQALINDLE